MNYTKEDVIMWADDPRVEGAIGKECYFADNHNICLERAINDNRKTCKVLDSVENGFVAPFRTKGSISYSCIIIKKEPEIKYNPYAPYDLSNKEDRDELRLKFVTNKNNGEEVILIRFYNDPVYGWTANGVTADNLLDHYVFTDTGEPVGKPVEEVEE